MFKKQEKLWTYVQNILLQDSVVKNEFWGGKFEIVIDKHELLI